jgi:FkbM family methyltransferase
MIKEIVPIQPPVTFIKRVRRFLYCPLLVKYLILRRHVRKLPENVPVPTQFPYGIWWLLERNSLAATLANGGFETAETHFIQRYLRPGVTVLDIGAHHGFYTLLASRLVGRTGRVLAFEPSPRERKRLERHVRLNSCSNVRTFRIALGAADKNADLYLVDGAEDWCNSLRPPARDGPGGISGNTRKVGVKVKVLDEFLTELGVSKIDFVKLDVEGAELEVLQGASQLLHSSYRPVFLIEVEDIRTEPWGYKANEIVRFLAQIGYRWFRLSPDGRPSPIPSNLDKYEANFVAAPQEKAEALLELCNTRKGWNGDYVFHHR